MGNGNSELQSFCTDFSTRTLKIIPQYDVSWHHKTTKTMMAIMRAKGKLENIVVKTFFHLMFPNVSKVGRNKGIIVWVGDE